MNPIRMNDRVVHGFIFFPGFFPVNEAKFNTVRLLGRPTGSKGISFTVSLDPVGLLSGIFRGRGAGQAGARPMSGPVPKISTYSTSQAAPGRESCPVLTTRIIPCLDVKDGRVVKGVNFVDLRDAGDAVENAKFYAEAGADELCFLDITASSDRRAIVANLVERVADEIFIPFTVGGGIRTEEDIHAILHAGADKVSINTAVWMVM